VDETATAPTLKSHRFNGTISGWPKSHPRVIGLLNFGFWTSPPWTGGHGAGACHLRSTRIATRILAAGQS
jgi:hypothetical protein